MGRAPHASAQVFATAVRPVNTRAYSDIVFLMYTLRESRRSIDLHFDLEQRAGAFHSPVLVFVTTTVVVRSVVVVSVTVVPGRLEADTESEVTVAIGRQRV